MASSTVAQWKGGDNLLLVKMIHQVAVKHTGRYEDLLQELTNIFSNDEEKLKIVKSCVEKMRSVSVRFKNKRKGANAAALVPSLFEIAENTREKKKAYIGRSSEVKMKVVNPGAHEVVTFLTPKKKTSGKAPVMKEMTLNEKEKKAMLERLSEPVFTLADFSKDELSEAMEVQESLREVLEMQELRMHQDASVEKENESLKSLFEVAFRALIAENVKKPEIYLCATGSEVNWDINVKDSSTPNSLMSSTQASLSSSIIQGKSIMAMKPEKLIDSLVVDHATYTWFVGMFLESAAAKEAVKALEVSMGQAVQMALLKTGDKSDQLYVSMAEENSKVQDGTTTLFAFYRAKFSRLKAEGAGFGSEVKIRHVTHEEEDLPKEFAGAPEEVKEAYKVLLQKPISKHPDGRPVREVQTQKESTSIESVWELKESADKVATWLGKKNKDKRKKEEEDSESSSGGEDQSSQQKKKEGQPPKKQKGLVRKLQQQVQSLENYKRKVEAKKPQDRDGKSGRDSRDKPECFDYRDTGKCSRGSSCKFEHREKDGRGGRQPPHSSSSSSHSSTPSDACRDLVRSGKCRKGRDCRSNHGKSSRTAKKQCLWEEKGKLCPHLFRQGGCNYFHKYVKN